MNWRDILSSIRSAGPLFLPSVHFALVFLQQVGSACLLYSFIWPEVNDRIVIKNTANIATKLKKTWLFRFMVLVWGFDESIFHNVTANLKFLFARSNRIFM